MALRINLNTAAYSAHRTLSANDTALSKSIERLSSGFKVNSAGDDPAGLVISEKLRAQVAGLGQAIKNSGDAVNMVKTAEGALGEVHRLLRSMRDLAVHAANTGATDSASAQADQAQIDNAINSLNKIASETQFGSRKLLDGSAGIKTFINGSNVMAGDFSFASGLSNGADIKVAVSTAAQQAVLSSGATYGGDAAISSVATYGATGSVFGAAGSIVLSTLSGGTATAINVASASTVSQVVDAINAYTADTGVTAAYDETAKTVVLTKNDALKGSADTFTMTYTGGTAFATGATTATGFSGTFATADSSLYVNGVKVDFTTGDSVDTFIAKVNAKTSLSGVVASFNTSTNKIDFKSQAYGSSASVNVTSGTMFLGSTTSASNDAGQNAVASVTKTVAGVTSNVSDQAWSNGDGLTIKDSLGNTIVLTAAGGSATSDATSQFTTEVNTLTFQVGAYAGQTRAININSVYAENMGNGVVADKNIGNINLTTAQGAQDAIQVIDKAISDVSNIRSSLGATQRNVLESSINSLSIAKEMVAASESTIRDTDMASEMVEFTKIQILQQSGIAMLAQANSGPQALLSLLRG